jgi:maleamate amidohydrolase
VSQELNENYRGAFDGSLGFGKKPALVLVDFVRAYFDENSPLYAGVDEALTSGLRILEAARAAGIPVLYTNVVYQKGGADGGIFFRKVPALQSFEAGNPLGEWAEGLEPRDDELVLSKQYASAVSTSGCIRATCVDACQHGFIPIVVADACGDRHEAPHEANLFDMNAKYGDVVDENTVVDYLKSL